jgi:hypothetical protein
MYTTKGWFIWSLLNFVVVVVALGIVTWIVIDWQIASYEEETLIENEIAAFDDVE